MSTLGEVFDNLGENIIPEVAAIVFPDTCFIRRATETKDDGGAMESTWADDNATAIPCSYKPQTIRQKAEQGGKWISVLEYIVTMPTNQSAELIDITANDRLRVIARGNQPEKTFRIIAIKNKSGVVLEIVCNLEN